MTMRIMGLDYGSKTVGVAVSDPLGITAQGVETICRKDENKLRKTCARIEALIEEYQRRGHRLHQYRKKVLHGRNRYRQRAMEVYIPV